jgi:uncharacterized protein YggE
VSFLATASLQGQQGGAELPVISASASGRVEIEADYAVLTLGVITQDSTPTLAAKEMDIRLRALTDTLIALGFPQDSLPTARYQVAPNRDYNAAQQIVGYTASAAIRLTIWELARTPTLIEAALTAGATDVSGLEFRATDEREARDKALRRALAEAEQDARVLAEAAGGQLGDPIEISTSESTRPSTRGALAYFDAPRAVQLSAITPSAIVVDARVTGRWALVKN